MNVLSRRSGWFGAIVLAIVPVSMAMAQTPDIVDRPECPHTWDKDVSRQLPIPGPLTNIPEYHDCQRFLIPNKDGGGLKYIEMEAIFVRYRADSVFDSAAVLIVPAQTDTAGGRNLWNPILAPATPTTHLAVVGQVLSYGKYAPLGIVDTYSCILLEWDVGVTPAMYHAWMVGVGTQGNRCIGADPTLLPTTHVRKLFVTPYRARNIPTVSRWDWDSKRREQYIGMTCPNGWCDIHGQKAYHHSPNYATPTIVKGMYDEQYLAKYGSSGLKMDGAFGTIFPDPRLGSRSVQLYNSGRFLPAAYAALSLPSPKYLTGLNFVAAPPLATPLENLKESAVANALNQVSLCFSTSSQSCPGEEKLKSSSHPCAVKTWSNSQGSWTGTWYAQVTRAAPSGATASDSTIITCVDFMETGEFQPPPVVRWRWDVKDETIWISCPLGCCKVNVQK